jgi:hypothetical protein
MAISGNNTGGGSNPFGDGKFRFTIKELTIKMGERVAPGQDDKIPMNQKEKEPWLQIAINYLEPETNESILENYLNMPKGLAFNEKNKWIQRLAHIVGKNVKVLCKEENDLGKAKIASKFVYDFDLGIDSLEELWNACAAGRIIVFNVLHDGKSILGKTIILDILTKDSGWAGIADSAADIQIQAPAGKPKPVQQIESVI